MNKNRVFILALFLSAITVFGQKFCYVDMEYIKANIPEYQQAQLELDVFSKRWEKEIGSMRDEIDKMTAKYNAEEVLYTDEIKSKKMSEIQTKQSAMDAYIQEKFGPNGELFTKRQELIKPILDAIYDAVDKLAKEKRYDFVFDKSSGLTVLYAKSSFDKSDLVLKYLGY